MSRSTDSSEVEIKLHIHKGSGGGKVDESAETSTSQPLYPNLPTNGGAHQFPGQHPSPYPLQRGGMDMPQMEIPPPYPTAPYPTAPPIPAATVITEQPAPSSDNPADSLIVALDDPELKQLRRRNIFFLVLAGVSCLACGNLFFGVVGLVFNTIAEFDFGAGKKESGRKNSKIGLVITIVGMVLVCVLIVVVVLLSMSD